MQENKQNSLEKDELTELQKYESLFNFVNEKAGLD